MGSSELDIPRSWSDIMKFLHDENFSPGMLQIHAAYAMLTHNSHIRNLVQKSDIISVPGGQQTPDFADQIIHYYAGIKQQAVRPHGLGIRVARANLLREAGVSTDNLMWEIDAKSLETTAGVVGAAILRNQLESLAQDKTGRRIKLLPKDAAANNPSSLHLITKDITVVPTETIGFTASNTTPPTKVPADETSKLVELFDTLSASAYSEEASRQMLLDAATGL